MIEYTSNFQPSKTAEHVLRSGKIISNEESASDMISRVARTLGKQEERFSGSEQASAFVEALGQALDSKEIIMSTPIMTNAGRHLDRPLTACTVPTSDLSSTNQVNLRKEIVSLHEQGMGTGFNLDETEDPVATLRFLNQVAVESAQSGREERPVGNMAVLSVRHPRIVEFINSKIDVPKTGDDWKFNISVNIDDAFMDALDRGERITLQDGHSVKAQSLFDEICEAATQCADPGVVFLDRMNARNPIPGMGEYKTTAPCAEVGLIEGETCQFGYINLGKFISLDSNNNASVDFKKLEATALLMTRALDNGLEISQNNFDEYLTKYVSMQKRKIGIGLCGVADAISTVGLAYDSAAARILMQDVLSFINFASKEASIRLAEERGSFKAMDLVIGNRHREKPGHIENLYGDKNTSSVSSDQWKALSRYIKDTRKLRNVSTIALPPTGRSALIIDASTGIEPHFDTLSADQSVLQSLKNALHSKYGVDLNKHETHTNVIRDILAGAPRISPMGHIGMVASMQEFTDEAVAKTINLPRGSSSEQVREAYINGHQAGMSGVTVYVDGTHTIQPKEVK